MEDELKPAPLWAKLTAAITRRLPYGRSRVVEGLFRHSSSRFRGRMPQPLGGYAFDCALRDPIARNVFLTGGYSTQELAFVRAALSEGMVFVDVGAHWGLFSLVAAGRVGSTGRVLALEPDPRMCARLRSNVAYNRLEQVQVFDVAAADCDKTMKLAGYDEAGDNWATSRLTADKTAGGASFAVKTRPLDALLDENGVAQADLVKIDVEGAEDLVLAGMRSGLERRRYHRIMLELHPGQLAERGRTIDELGAVLRAAGYRGYSFDYSAAGIRRSYYRPWADFSEFVQPLEQGLSGPAPHTLWLAPGVKDLH